MTNPWPAAGLVVAGAFACFLGGGIGAALGAWSARGHEALLSIVADHPTGWRWTNWPWIAGIPAAAAGLIVVARRLQPGPATSTGAALWVVATFAGVVAFGIQAEAGVWAAGRLRADGAVPDGYAGLAAAGGAFMVAFMVLAHAGSLILGVASLHTPGVPAAVAWSAVAAPVVLLPLVAWAIPAGALLTALPFAAVAFAPGTSGPP